LEGGATYYAFERFQAETEAASPSTARAEPRPTLTRENFAVDSEEIFALHTLFARHAPDQQRPISPAEAFFRIGSRNQLCNEREGAVFQFHYNSLKRFDGLGDFNQLYSSGWSGPNIEPDAIRKSSEYPI
jgi:hypothetical protein